MIEEVDLSHLDAPPPRKWDERAVQDAVYVYCSIKNHPIVVPNSCVFGWEADVVSVNKTGFISEFEVKVTRADFKAEAKKGHRRLLLDPVQKWAWTEKTTVHPRPNYFYFAVPEGLVKPEELPDYAGLIYVREFAGMIGKHVGLYFGTAGEVKPARRLHRDKITEGQRSQLARSLSARFWRLRIASGCTVAEE